MRKGSRNIILRSATDNHGRGNKRAPTAADREVSLGQCWFSFRARRLGVAGQSERSGSYRRVDQILRVSATVRDAVTCIHIVWLVSWSDLRRCDRRQFSLPTPHSLP